MFRFIRNLFGKANFEHLDIDAYRARFADPATHTLVDVRTALEFEQGHLPGALNVPLHTLGQHIDDVPTDKPVVVVCASSHRSPLGARMLANAGHPQVYNLKGGLGVWARRGLPVER